jgi:hypothetical protein
LKNGNRELGVYVQERGALDSLVKDPLDWISSQKPNGAITQDELQKHSSMGDGTKARKSSG